MSGNFTLPTQQFYAPMSFDYQSEPLPPWSIDFKPVWVPAQPSLSNTENLDLAPKAQEFEVSYESWIETPLLPEAPVEDQQQLEQWSSHGSTLDDGSHERIAPLPKSSECPTCRGDHSKFEDVTSS